MLSSRPPARYHSALVDLSQVAAIDFRKTFSHARHQPATVQERCCPSLLWRWPIHTCIRTRLSTISISIPELISASPAIPATATKSASAFCSRRDPSALQSSYQQLQAHHHVQSRQHVQQHQHPQRRNNVYSLDERMRHYHGKLGRRSGSRPNPPAPAGISKEKRLLDTALRVYHHGPRYVRSS